VLIKQLCVVEPSKRLGCSVEGVNEIRRQPFFEGIDWAALDNYSVAATRAPGPHLMPQRSAAYMKNLKVRLSLQALTASSHYSVAATRAPGPHLMPQRSAAYMKNLKVRLSLQALTHRTDSRVVRGGFGCLKGVLRRVEPAFVHQTLFMGGPLTVSRPAPPPAFVAPGFPVSSSAGRDAERCQHCRRVRGLAPPSKTL
jgi:hypothetical protein